MLTSLLARLLPAALAAAVLAAPALGAPARSPGEVIVGLRDGLGAKGRAALEDRAGVRLGRRVTSRGARTARITDGEGLDATIAQLVADPAVRWAEPNEIVHVDLTPNDPVFPDQWGLLNAGQQIGSGPGGVAGADIGAPAAWDITTGSDRVRVAVLDTGVAHSLPDLAPNIGVVNPEEAGDGRETNGIDDDGNGFVDDWRGWDFVADDADPLDENLLEGHGTFVAGVVGARGNDGAGVAGVSWSSRLIPVRGLDAAGSGFISDLAAGITYAAARGARILNASFGTTVESAVLREAIEGAPGMLVVASAGNASGNNDSETFQNFPCEFSLENVVCVAASDQDDNLAGFSSFGKASVDLAAPGENIIGLHPDGGTRILNGTSFSAPLTAGVAALVLAANPTASTRQLRGALLAGVTPLAALTTKVATGGRLNAPGALARVPAAQPGPGGATGPVLDVTAAGARLTGTVPTSLQRLAYHFEYGPTTAYGSQTPTRPLLPGAGHEVSETVNRLPAGAQMHARLVVAAIGGITFGTDQAFTIPGGPPPATVAAPPTTPAAVPKAGIRRVGRAWIATLRLGEAATVSGSVRRRVVAAPRSANAHALRFRTVRTLRARGLAAGVRRVRLGRLAPGRYRVTLRVVGATRRATIVRTLRVPPVPRAI